jgi:hypothetical protein
LSFDDLQGAKNAIENYSYEDPSFETSRHSEFLKGLCEAADEKDNDKMIACVREHTRILSLDKVSTKLIVDVKKVYTVEPEDQIMPDLTKSDEPLDLVNGTD